MEDAILYAALLEECFAYFLVAADRLVLEEFAVLVVCLVLGHTKGRLCRCQGSGKVKTHSNTIPWTITLEMGGLGTAPGRRIRSQLEQIEIAPHTSFIDRRITCSVGYIRRFRNLI